VRIKQVSHDVRILTLQKNYEFVLAAFTIVTAIAFGLIPFKLSFRPVVLAVPWDFILFLLWCAAFGLMRSAAKGINGNYSTRDDDAIDEDNGDAAKRFIDHYDNMQHKVCHWLSQCRGILTKHEKVLDQSRRTPPLHHQHSLQWGPLLARSSIHWGRST
jgi:hypothetical protein